MPRFAAKGNEAAWRTIYAHLVKMNVNDVLTHEQLHELVPHIAGPVTSLRRAIQELQEHQSRTLVNVRGAGWRVAHAREHITVARHGRQRAGRILERSREIVEHTRLDELSPAERAQHVVVRDGLTFLASILTQHESDIEKLRRQQDTFEGKVDDRLTRIEKLLGKKSEPDIVDAEVVDDSP